MYLSLKNIELEVIILRIKAFEFLVLSVKIIKDTN